MQGNIFTILAFLLAILALLATGYSLWSLRKLNELKKIFFAGSNAKDLELVIHDLTNGLKILQQNQQILENRIKNLRNDFGLAVQKVGLVRFNPFSDGGGNLSFCIALLDGYNTGMVITSMHGREQNRIYTKQISEGKCDIQLTEEELKAIEAADQYHKKLIS